VTPRRMDEADLVCLAAVALAALFCVAAPLAAWVACR